MTSTAAVAERVRALTDQDVDRVRESDPHGEAPRHADHQTNVERPAGRAVRVQDLSYLVVLSVVQLTWIAALAYGLIRLVH